MLDTTRSSGIFGTIIDGNSTSIGISAVDEAVVIIIETKKLVETGIRGWATGRSGRDTTLRR